MFEKLNLILQEYDVKFFDNYEILRNNFIKILNEIVDNYIYKKSTDISNLDQLKYDYDLLIKENEGIKRELEKYKENETPLRKEFQPEYNWQAPVTDTRSLNAQNDIKKKIVQTLEKKQALKNSYGNDLLKWNNTKDFNQVLNNLNYKTISLKQMKEIIKELYDAKKNYDNKNKEQKQSLETLEQFMYYHLKHKYGLNNMVVEWVFAIIQGIKSFSQNDAEVSLFGLVQ